MDYNLKTAVGFDCLQTLMQPVSPYGQEALRRLHPLPAPKKIQARLDDIEECLRLRSDYPAEHARILHLLGQTRDIRGSLHRDGVWNDVEFFEIKRFLLQIEALQALLEPVGAAYSFAFDSCAAALSLLDPSGEKQIRFHIADSYSPALAALRQEKRRIELALREEDCPTLLERRRELAQREDAEENVVREALTRNLAPYRKPLLRNAKSLGALDLTLQCAALAEQYQCAKPSIGGSALRLRTARHPGIENPAQAFVPLDISLEKGVTVITGANMGGKSVALKTIALNALMMLCGLYPFAEEASCPVFASVQFLAGDAEGGGLSSFGSEIVRFIALTESPAPALLLLDEPARGTNPEEGAAIAKGITEHLGQGDDFAVLATHYEGVASLAGAHYQVKGLRELSEEEIPGTPAQRIAHIAKCMDYGLFLVSDERALPRDALKICKLLGMPEEILEKIEKHYCEELP